MGTSYNSNIVTDGLVLCLDAANPRSYPLSGNTWLDLSGQGNNGTLTNGPTFNTNNGGSLVFDGSNDYIDVESINIGSAYSIVCVFKSSNVVSNKNVYDVNYNTYSNTGNVGPRVEQNSAGYVRWVWSGDTSNNGVYNYSATVSISSNVYYHTVFTMNQGSIKVYLNGVYNTQTSSSNGYVTTFNDINIGRGFKLDSSRYFIGNVPIFQIYNRVLTPEEIRQNFNATRGRYGY